MSTKLELDLDLLSRIQPTLTDLTIEDYVVLLLLIAAGCVYLSKGQLWDQPDPYRYKLFERPQEQFTTNVQQRATRNIAEKLEREQKDAVIFWGSQSGTAEALAHRLARDCLQRFNLSTIVADLSDYDPGTIAAIPKSKFVVFLVSTYGEGDPSDNATEFLEWLQKTSSVLADLRYVAFGLGNSNYLYYNKVVDDFVSSLDRLSATALLPVGKADDANNTEEDFSAWRDTLFSRFQSVLGLEECAPTYVPSIIIEEAGSHAMSKVQTHMPQPLKLSRKAARDYSTIDTLAMKTSRVISGTSSGRCCLHIEVDIRAQPQLKYKTGDHLAIWPTNPTTEVERLLSVLGLVASRDNSMIITQVDASRESRIPSSSTLQALFTHHLEICGPVSRDTISTLSRLAPSKAVEEFFQKLSTKSDYLQHIAHNHVTLGRLLEDATLHDTSVDWSKLPLSFIIESLRPMTPRYYSISSSSMVSPRQMAITVAVSPSELPNNPAVAIPGLATSYLNALIGTEAPTSIAHIRRSTFKMPFLHKTPIVLIAAGTGIAPFRAFIQERAQMAQISNQEIGPILLVFGCRNPSEDYLYKEELEHLQNTALKDKLYIITAFSRLPGQKKCYVQDRLAEPAVKSQLLEFLCHKEGSLYFCGSTTMAKSAGRTIVEAVREHLKANDAETRGWQESMKRLRRWQEDVWG